MHNRKGKWWENPFIFHINVEMWQLTDLSFHGAGIALYSAKPGERGGF